MKALFAATLLASTSAVAAQDLHTPVPDSVLQTIGDVLPEQSSAGAAFVSDVYSPNLVISEPATVRAIFLWEGAGYRNSLGRFTYEDEPDGSVTILHSDLLIADASFWWPGTMEIGDTYDLRNPDGSLRVFQPGERVGFFVVADGWNQEALIQDWVAGEMPIPSSDPAENGAIGRGCYTSINKLNPEFAGGFVDESRHLAMIWFPGIAGFLGGDDFLVSGFEDLNRTGGSDDDFNDLVFAVTASPIDALEETEAYVFHPGDPDGDGVVGIDDAYPNDPNRAFVTRYPTNGTDVVGFEDQYPAIGDADYNDAVLAYFVEQVTSAEGDVTDVQMTLHLVGRGAGYDHLVGVHFPDLPADATGSIHLERFYSDAGGTVILEDPRSIAELIASDARRIDDLFPSTTQALPPLPGVVFTNTQFGTIDRPAGSARMRMTFDEPVPASSLGTAPFDLYLGVKHGDEVWDVHFPGLPGFEDRPESLPAEEVDGESGTFLDGNGYPWALRVPTDWRFPMEKVRIWNAYPQFDSWVATSGGAATGWYEHPVEGAGFVAEPLLNYVPTRDWSIDLPTP